MRNLEGHRTSDVVHMYTDFLVRDMKYDFVIMTSLFHVVHVKDKPYSVHAFCVIGSTSHSDQNINYAQSFVHPTSIYSSTNQSINQSIPLTNQAFTQAHDRQTLKELVCT